MDWNSKAPPPPSWDFTELEQETFSNLDTVNGSNNTFGDDQKSIREDFSVDLKLGHHHHHHHHHLGNELVDTWKDPGLLPKPASSSPSGSSKRSRGSYNGSQAVSCLVDGCNADLSSCRDYHRRHKVCELHSKTPQVTIGGHKQRFCQQCSRFHSLEEFDEGKRSCRKRLDGHNRRRRKPQPEPFSRYGNLLSNYPGTQLFPFSSSLAYPSTAVGNASWGGVVVKTEADSGLHNHHPQLPFLDKQNMFMGSSSPTTSTSYKGSDNKPFPLLQDHSQTGAPEVSACPHPFLRTFPFHESSSGARSKAFYDIQHSDCALSLLSSQQAQTSEIGSGHNISQLGSIPMVHPAATLHTHDGGGLEPMSSVVVANGNGNAEVLHCPTGMFNMGSDGNEAPHSHQTLPSHWG